MATYIKVNDNSYEAIITGRLQDGDWDDRETKTIRLEMTYADALAIFIDNVKWSILQDVEHMEEQVTEEGEILHIPVVVTEEYDNSDYNMAGEITDHRDGTVSIKMGKKTELEEVQELADMLLLETLGV